MTKRLTTSGRRLDNKIDDLRHRLDDKIDDLGYRLDDKIDNLGHRVERIEAGIGTLKWVLGAEVAVIGVILAFIKAC